MYGDDGAFQMWLQRQGYSDASIIRRIEFDNEEESKQS